MRALRWLVDEKNGTATVGDLSMWLIGSLRGGAALAVTGFLIRAGWVAAQENRMKLRKDGHPYLHDTVLKITPAGRLWRDYIDFEPERLALDRLETHAKIRALELALAPLVACHKEIQRRGFIADTIPNRTQCAIAAEILEPSGDLNVIYPWTPSPSSRARKTK